MTGPEREDLKITLEFLREWRDDDRTWKAATDKRLTKVEQRLLVEDAVAAHTAAVATDVKEAAASSQLSRRWRVGIALSLSATLVIGLANMVLRMTGH